jgi:hypothetical protein
VRRALLAALVAIPNPLPTTLPQYQGAPATPRPMVATKAPQNPYLARDPRSNIHNDSWMTDAYRRRGPLGTSPTAFSGTLLPALCGSLTFHSRGFIVAVCPRLGSGPQARVIDPGTLEALATYDLPNAPDPPGTKAYQNFSGGGYFFLDHRDRIWTATKTNHIFVLEVAADGRRISLAHDYVNTGLASDDRISSALPGFGGNTWFVSKQGNVGILHRGGVLRLLRLHESVQNSFAVDRSGVYVVSDRRMYRLVSRHGRPRVAWKVRYRNSGIVKPGQAEAGSGTTPTLMRGGYVAITDNADPMNVVVYRRAKRLHGRPRVVCQVPVFTRGASATENSLITAGRSLFVENNYGYQDPFGPQSGALTTPGFARVDVRRGGRGCGRVWTNRSVRASSVVPKLSTRTGLIYTYTREPSSPLDQPYFWTAIDAHTGKTAWKVYAGSGLGFNNNYAGLALGADGTAYLGVLGGIVALRDG